MLLNVRICLVVACGLPVVSSAFKDMVVNKFRKPSVFSEGKHVKNFLVY